MSEYYGVSTPTSDFLAHYGVKGMKWEIRRYVKEDGSLTARGKMRYGRTKEAKAVKASLRERNKFSKQYKHERKDLLTKFEKTDPLYANKLAEDYVTKGLRIPKSDSANAEIVDYYKNAHRSLAQDATGFSLGKQWHKKNQVSGQKLRDNKNKQARMIMRDLKKRGYDKEREGHYYAKQLMADGYSGKRFAENNGSVFRKENDHGTLQLWQSLSESERKNKKRKRKVIT